MNRSSLAGAAPFVEQVIAVDDSNACFGHAAPDGRDTSNQKRPARSRLARTAKFAWPCIFSFSTTPPIPKSDRRSSAGVKPVTLARTAILPHEGQDLRRRWDTYGRGLTARRSECMRSAWTVKLRYHRSPPILTRGTTLFAARQRMGHPVAAAAKKRMRFVRKTG